MCIQAWMGRVVCRLFVGFVLHSVGRSVLRKYQSHGILPNAVTKQTLKNKRSVLRVAFCVKLPLDACFNVYTCFRLQTYGVSDRVRFSTTRLDVCGQTDRRAFGRPSFVRKLRHLAEDSGRTGAYSYPSTFSWQTCCGPGTNERHIRFWSIVQRISSHTADNGVRWLCFWRESSERNGAINTRLHVERTKLRHPNALHVYAWPLAHTCGDSWACNCAVLRRPFERFSYWTRLPCKARRARYFWWCFELETFQWFSHSPSRRSLRIR